MDCLERYANIGIRIEDDVLITQDGPVVLTETVQKPLRTLNASLATTHREVMVWTGRRF